MNLPTTPTGLGTVRELSERRAAFDWGPDEDTQTDYRVQHLLHPPSTEPSPAVAVALPTLFAIGLGPQLAELERICAESQRGKHSGASIITPGASHHVNKAMSHLHFRRIMGRDGDSLARHLIHAAARLLMAAACADEGEL